MKTRNIISAFILALLLVLTGCQSASETPNDSTQGQEQGLTTSIELIDLDENTVSSKEVTFEEGQSLMDVLKANFEVDEDGGYINGIDTLVANPDDKEWISIAVNGEY